eukprot:TRINITY_DN9396_c0_g1_i4.p1 TRINITY_DN9396_c0_g1~~TRINITY_DN9396_c0_g1_i4.p1  ORF type:complete len:217 (+),score=47.61 TRINITY_DN9396_c0_g1_i4:71-721(+)
MCIRDSWLDFMKEYEQRYKDWKRRIVLYLEHRCSQIDMKEAMLVCGRCGFRLCDITSLKFYPQVQGSTLRRVKINSLILTQLPAVPEDPVCAIDWSKVIRSQGGTFIYVGCNKKHIIGASDPQMEEIYIARESNLKICYPNAVVQEYVVGSTRDEDILRENNLAVIQRTEDKSDLYCVICFESFRTLTEFRNHVKDDKDHKNNFKEFIKNLDDTRS